MEKVSKKLRNLKVNSKHVDDFDAMKQALERSGVVKKQRQGKRVVGVCQNDPPLSGRQVTSDHNDTRLPGRQVKHEPPEGALLATCLFTHADKGYCFVVARGKRYFLHNCSIWGGVKPRTGDRFQVVADERTTRVLRAVRLRRE